MRSFIVIICVFSIATIFAETLGLSLLWFRGQLTAENLKEIRVILTGQNQDDLGLDDESQNRQTSNDEVLRERAMRILALNTRQEELEQLKTMISERANTLIDEQQQFEIKKKEFEKHLLGLNEGITSESTEQARGILLKSKSTATVESLMGLSLEENIMLLKGMPEKKIAEILQEFSNGEDEQATRGKEIFEAIARGEPSNSLIRATTQKLTQDATVADTEQN